MECVLFTVLCSIIIFQDVTKASPVHAAGKQFDFGNNLTRVTWAHAVNDAAYLMSALASDVLMLEADIVLGTLDGSGSDALVPVMGHPPADTSDLSLADFLDQVKEHNRAGINAKGIKLDFKSIEAFSDAQEIISNFYLDSIDFPVWLNADILPGPIDSEVTPVDPTRFLELASRIPETVLSIGWTTRYGGELTEGAYERAHADAMLATIEASGVRQVVTFPVRAGLAANSEPVLAGLLAGAGPAATLTVWSSDGDYVDIDKLRALIVNTGVDRVYLDVPTVVSDALNLPADD